MIYHYYHAYADGQWLRPVQEHIEALATITEPMHITVGIVGKPENRRAVRAAFAGFDVDFLGADVGWEQVTIHRLQDDLALLPDDTPVLYAHTKGAAHESHLTDPWRREMTRRCVYDWRHCINLLAHFDAVGAHWLTRYDDSRIDNPIFAGNFWWARAAYLRKLPRCSMINRHEAEAWVGRADPLACNLLAGWPGAELYQSEKPR